MRVRVVGLIDVLHLGDWRRAKGCSWIVVFPLSEIGFVMLMTGDLQLVVMMVWLYHLYGCHMCAVVLVSAIHSSVTLKKIKIVQ